MPLTQVQPGMLGTPQPYNFKNRIINGAMVIDQRNAGATGTSLTYTVDRWAYQASQNSKGTWGRNLNSVTPPVGFSNYLGFQSSSAYTVGSSERFALTQYIEGFNGADLDWGTANAKTVTLSFWVRSSLTGTFGGSIAEYNNGFPSYPFSYTISAANTWEQKSVTITGPTSGSWTGASNNGFAGVIFSLGSGSAFSGTAGSWNNSTYFTSATGATSVVGTNGATFYITGCQFEVGVTATDFDYRPYGLELMLCQRYFQRLRNTVSNRYLSILQAWATTSVYGVISRFPVPFRANPTVSVSSSFGGYYNSTSGGASTSQPSSLATDGQSIETGDWPGASGLTPGQGLVCFWNNNSFIDGSAEL